MKSLLPFVLILSACPTEPPAPKDPATIVEPTEKLRTITPEESGLEEAIRIDVLCFKVAGITEASLQGTVYSKGYDPEKFLAGCQENLEGPKTDEWNTYYDCVVDAGDKSYVVKCAGVAVSPF